MYPVKAVMTRSRSLAWSARGRRRARPGLRILFFHRVSDDRDELAVTPSAFAAQMAALARAGLRGVAVSEVVRLLDEGRDDEPVIGLSFDDAYHDVAVHARPVLERHGFRATVYVATGVVDGRARFAWYENQPQLMLWSAIAELDGGVFEFDPHTITHPNLLTLEEPDVKREIRGSKEELELHLGRATRTLCYPAGLFTAREEQIAAASGFLAAVSCEPGANVRGTNRFALHRIQVDARDSVLDVMAKAAGAHDSPLPFRGSWRRVRYGMPSNRS